MLAGNTSDAHLVGFFSQQAMSEFSGAQIYAHGSPSSTSSLELWACLLRGLAPVMLHSLPRISLSVV